MRMAQRGQNKNARFHYKTLITLLIIFIFFIKAGRNTTFWYSQFYVGHEMHCFRRRIEEIRHSMTMTSLSKVNFFLAFDQVYFNFNS